jgi:stage II sporulation SpoE-like protein/ANTAR domain-containing protein
VAGSGDDMPRLAALAERQRRELARLRAEADTASVIAMARGALMERHGWSAAEAARQLADMATAAGLPLPELAGALLHQVPDGRVADDVVVPGAAHQAPSELHDLLAVAAAERAASGPNLVMVLADQLLGPLGAAAVAVWLLEVDGALRMLGDVGLSGTDSSRWLRLPPQFDCAEQRVTGRQGDLWWPAGPPDADPVPVAAPWGRHAARAVLALRDRTGSLLGVMEVWWPGSLDRFGQRTRTHLIAAADGFAEVLTLRLSHGDLRPAASESAMFGILDEVTGSVLVARPLHDPEGSCADFAIKHVSPGYVDPAGRPAAEITGLTLLEAYPASGSGDGIVARALRISAQGRAEHVPGPVSGLTGKADVVEVEDLRAVPFFGDIIFTWHAHGESGRLAGLLDQVQRLGQLGGWEEHLATGAVRWTDSAFAVFGLDPRQTAPIPLADLHSFVITADRELVRRFRESLLMRRESSAATFRIIRPGDAAIRQIRVFAEPVTAPGHSGDVMAVRGVFQDVSAHYLTQVALAVTRDQLADIEQRAAEEHRLALRLQRAIIPPDAPPVATAGVDVAVRYRPADPGHLVAGDWYDALLLPSKKLLLVVGDITGHGIDAVTGMVAARNALRGLASTGAGPAELLKHLNYAACHLTEGIAGTVVCGLYQPETRVLRWARAGHLPPVLARDGQASTLPLPGGVLLGLDPDAEYEEAEVQLRIGDFLVMFTDGLIERRADSISDALRELVAASIPAGPDAAAHADRLLVSAASDTGDDACLVVTRIL